MVFERQRVGQLLAKFSELKILVIGDLMLDEFLWGKVSRISPEAPVPVVEVQSSSYFPGGAANVARNLCALGAGCRMAGVVGKDEAGAQLKRLLLEDGVDVREVVEVLDRPTTHKSRIVARQQQVVRVDRESKAPLSEVTRESLIGRVIRAVEDCDAVIIEDYAKGLIEQTLVDAVMVAAQGSGKIVTVDPNPNNPLRWAGARAIKPNRSEAFAAAGLAVEDTLKAVEAAGQILQKKWEVPLLLLTMGEDGMLLMEKGQPAYHTPTQAQEVYDVSGAGDTSIAVFTLALAAGATGIEAAEMANHAAGVVVGKLGTATLTREELQKSLADEK
jgi:D-glycero-beta-D-manno-heptose-7-phosphate kinase